MPATQLLQPSTPVSGAFSLSHPTHHKTDDARALLALGALGIVFGDIGTSPLYALRETVRAGGGPEQEVVLGSVSLIIWALLLSTTLVYVNAILRVTNRGEGGIFSLAALLGLHHRNPDSRFKRARLVLLGVALFGAAMLFGDAVITPAISVLSAVEGLKTAMPGMPDSAVPIATGVLAAFFLLQMAGTSRIGALFGPIMLVWFTVLGLLGAGEIMRAPEILSALNPTHAVNLLLTAPAGALMVLAAVFLAVTGGEALYADLGQFGRPSIALAWYGAVLPALGLNYLGQGALLLTDPSAIADPFTTLAPMAWRLPLVILATMATVIASQAVITGVFSLVQQAGHLRFLPPLKIRHTSAHNEHHVYVGSVNAVVGICAIAVVWHFGSSDALASAYGLAVSLAMIATSILFIATLWKVLRLPLPLVALIGVLVLGLDITFGTANASKIAAGGWLPALLAFGALVVMVSWVRGRAMLRATDEDQPIGHFVAHPAEKCRTAINRACVFLCPPERQTPATLLRFRRLFGATFHRVVLVTVWVKSTPRVAACDRVKVLRLGDNVTRISVFSGFMQRTDLPSILGPAFASVGLASDDVTYVVGSDRVRLPHLRWRIATILLRPLDMLFLVLSRNAQRPVDRFRLPPRRTIELGAVHEI